MTNFPTLLELRVNNVKSRLILALFLVKIYKEIKIGELKPLAFKEIGKCRILKKGLKKKTVTKSIQHAKKQ